jgi:carboxypeptidase C (cathepsin A)
MGWKIDMERHALQSQIGATDDLRYGMALNPHMKVWISHGYYDLVTPYFSTDRLARLMKLSDAAAKNLTVRHYAGGHMFYTWTESRKAFFKDISRLYTGA